VPFTYETLRTAISDWVENYEKTFQNNLDVVIVQAETRIAKAVQLPAWRKTFQGTCVCGRDLLAIPANFLSPYSLWLMDACGQYWPVENKEAEFVRAAYPTPTLGRPLFYALDGENQLRLGPRPDWKYGLELNYCSRPPSVVDLASTWLSQNAPDALFYACLKEAYAFMKGEKDMVDLYEQRYQEAQQFLLLNGHGRDRKDFYRKPDAPVET
jgi:hypothetical protein